jgi:carbamoyltransferase
MTTVLGISAFYHDSAAVLLVDGKVVAAAQEERFTRKKHDFGFPQRAIDYCLGEAGLAADEIDHVAFYDKPLTKFERLLETYIAFAPAGFRSFRMAMPLWLKEKLWMPRLMDRGLRKQYRGRYLFPSHHESHAASAFFPSPFEEAAILTMDGVGEWATASFGSGRDNKIELTHELHFPHSLGLLYSAFTYYTGFRVNSGEYKLMGLAPYGTPKYAERMLEHLLDLKEDGSFRMDMSYFNYCQGLTMTSGKLHRLFGAPPRKAESPLTQHEMDIAASIQKVTEEVVMRMGRHVHEVTGQKNLVLAGGVALNCVANGILLREGPFERIWIQPAAGDAGGALGAALLVWHQLLDQPRTVVEGDSQERSLLGPRFSDEEIRQVLEQKGAKFHHVSDRAEMMDRVADLMADEQVVGLFSGRMEFGPRALGARSIVGDARSRKMQRIMNVKIKFRESFRPFAPAVLAERAHEYFELEPGQDSPYMLLVADVRASHRRELEPADLELQGLDKLKVIRSDVPAITHVDYSARVQTVDPTSNQLFRGLIERFHAKTGCPVIINTSFNVRGEPIVCTPDDAYRCFMATNMDALVLEGYLLLKSEQPEMSKEKVAAYIASFDLD